MTANLAIGLWCSLGLLGLIAIRIPIAIAMTAIAVLGIYLVQGDFAAWFQLAGAPVNSTTYGLSVIPLFILMGNLAAHAGLSRDLFLLASRVVGALPGGLAISTILACAGFSTLSGSSLATAATIGRISIKEMLLRGYSPGLASGTVAAGGTIGILIPPSVMLVIYGLLTEQSVRQLFAAGVVPGLLLTFLFMLTVYIWVKLSKESIRKPETDDPQDQTAAIPLTGVLSLIVLVIAVLGGLYAGYFTATESAAIGTIGTLLIAMARGGLKGGVLTGALIETASTSAMIFFIIIGSALYATFLSVTGISGGLQSFVGGLDVSPTAVLIVICLIYVVLGCFMDSLGMMLLTIPIFYPISVQLGVDPIWFGVLVVMVIEVGLITPPLGMNVFIVKSIAPDVPIQKIFMGVLPFLIAFFVAIGLVMAVPDIALWLPRLFFGSA